MIRQLEEQLKEKQKDLVEIQTRKTGSPEHGDYIHRQVNPYSSPEPRRRDHPQSRNERGDYHQPSRSRKQNHPVKTTHSDSDEEFVPPTKPRKVSAYFWLIFGCFLSISLYYC